MAYLSPGPPGLEGQGKLWGNSLPELTTYGQTLVGITLHAGILGHVKSPCKIDMVGYDDSLFHGRKWSSE